MSIISNKDKGGNNSNFSWNHKVLIGLQSISDKIRSSGGGEPATPGVLDITGIASTTLNTWKSFTFVCVAGTIDIIGQTFPAGTYSFSNGKGTLTSIAYDASAATDCKIIYVI